LVVDQRNGTFDEKKASHWTPGKYFLH